jgi:chromate reductase
VKVLGISGSLRRGSYNRNLLRAAAELLPEDVEFVLWDGLKEVPPYDEDDDTESAPAAVPRLRAAIGGADAVLIATPEYNSSIPGQLKNAIDWASRPIATNVLRNKPVAVVGASTGAFGAVWSQAELRKVLGATGARVVDAEVAVGHAHERFDRDGRLVDEDLRGQLRETVELLVAERRPPLAPAAGSLSNRDRARRLVGQAVISTPMAHVVRIGRLWARRAGTVPCRARAGLGRARCSESCRWRPGSSWSTS